MSIHTLGADLFVIDGDQSAEPPVVAYRVHDRLYILGRVATTGQEAAVSAIKASYPTIGQFLQIEPDPEFLGTVQGVVRDSDLRIGTLAWGGWSIDNGEVLVLDPPDTDDPVIMMVPAHRLVLIGRRAQAGALPSRASVLGERLLALIDSGALELLCTAETTAPLDTGAARELLREATAARPNYTAQPVQTKVPTTHRLPASRAGIDGGNRY